MQVVSRRARGDTSGGIRQRLAVSTGFAADVGLRLAVALVFVLMTPSRLQIVLLVVVGVWWLTARALDTV
jgi:hypothetical protein